jgi:hypothetical protein
MDQNAKDLKQTLIYQPVLLWLESQRNCQRLKDQIRHHISACDILDEMWTSEIVWGEWEIVRLRRYKGKTCCGRSCLTRG